MGRKRIETVHPTPTQLRQLTALGLYRKGNRGAWYLPLHVEGTRYVRSTGTGDPSEALDLVSSLTREIEAEHEDNKRREGLWDVGTATEMHLAEKVRAKLSKNTLKNYRSLGRKVCAFFGAGTLLDDLTVEDIEAYIDLARETRKPYCVQIECNYFGSVLNWSADRKRTGKRAADLIPKSAWGHYEPRRRFLTPSEIGTLLAHCPPDWADCVMGWTYTGARLMELFSILPTDVDLRGQTIRIRGTKSDASSRTVPIAPPLLPTVEALVDGSVSPSEPLWDFPRGERGGVHPTALQGRFQRLVGRAGLDDLRIHDLRRTCGSLLASEGVSLHVIREVLGHRSILTTQRIYAHLTPSAVHAAMSRIPSPQHEHEYKEAEAS